MDRVVEHVMDIHLTVAAEVVARLDQLAAERGTQRAAVVREALAAYLERTEAERIEKAMVDYVEALAPHSGEFVRESEPPVVERLLRETTW